MLVLVFGVRCLVHVNRGTNSRRGTLNDPTRIHSTTGPAGDTPQPAAAACSSLSRRSAPPGRPVPAGAFRRGRPAERPPDRVRRPRREVPRSCASSTAPAVEQVGETEQSQQFIGPGGAGLGDPEVESRRSDTSARFVPHSEDAAGSLRRCPADTAGCSSRFGARLQPLDPDLRLRHQFRGSARRGFDAASRRQRQSIHDAPGHGGRLHRARRTRG